MRGLFDQYVNPGVEEIPHHRIVRGSRHRDRDRVDPADERTVVGHRLGPQPGCHVGGAVLVAIGDRDKAGAVERGHLFGVVAAEVTDADHAEPEFAVGALARLPVARHDGRPPQAASSTKSSASSKRSWVM